MRRWRLRPPRGRRGSTGGGGGALKAHRESASRRGSLGNDDHDLAPVGSDRHDLHSGTGAGGALDHERLRHRLGNRHGSAVHARRGRGTPARHALVDGRAHDRSAHTIELAGDALGDRT